MEIHKIFKLSGVFVWAGLSLAPVTAHADIMVTLPCGSVTLPAPPGANGTVTCPGLSSLSSVTLEEGADLAASGTFDVTSSFTPQGPGGVTWSPLSSVVNVGVSGNANQSATAGVTNVNFNSAFNVAVSTDILNGSVIDTDAGWR